MTEIQQKIAVANFIIDELHKDKPFNLVLDATQSAYFWNIVESASVYELRLPVSQRGPCTTIEVDKSNVDQIYHMLSSYIAKHDRFGVVASLGEVS